MLTLLVVLLLGAPLLLVALADSRRAVLLVLLVGGLPISMLSGPSIPLGPFGVLQPQAFYLLAILASLAIAVFQSTDPLAGTARSMTFYFAFLAYAAVSCAWSADLGEGIRFLFKLLAPALMLVAARHCLASDADRRLAEACILACCGMVTTLALLDRAGGGWMSPDSASFAAQGILTAPYMSPANFSFLVGTGALVALARYLRDRAPMQLLASAAFAAAVMLAFTRISMAGLVVAGALLVFLGARDATSRYLVPTAIVVAGVAAALTSERVRARFFFGGDLGTSNGAGVAGLLENLDTSGRTTLWTEALQSMGGRSEAFGAGLGSVDHWLNLGGGVNALHSEMLRIYIDTGALGLALFVAGLAQIGYVLWRSASTAARSRTQVRSALACAALAYYGATLMTDNSLNYVSEFGLYVFALAGIALSPSTEGVATQRPRAPVGDPKPRYPNLLR